MTSQTLLRPLAVDIMFLLVPISVGVFVFFLGRRFSRRPRIVRVGLTFLTISAIAMVVALLFRLIPQVADEAFSYVGGVIIVLCWIILGVIGLSWASSNRSSDVAFRVVLAVLPLALIGVESGGSLWFRFRDIEAWKNCPTSTGAIVQSSSMTCLPATAAMLLHHYGIEGVSEGEFAYLAGTSLFGTDSHVMARAMTQRLGKPGVRAVPIDASYDDMVARASPFIAQVQLKKFGNHAVLVKKITPHELVWIDPLDRFEQHVAPAAFGHVWTGGAIVIEGLHPRAPRTARN